jgi:hypothetical protein
LRPWNMKSHPEIITIFYFTKHHKPYIYMQDVCEY